MLPELQELLERTIEWAKTRDDIRVILMMGSLARTDFPADKHSDLDLELFTTLPTNSYQSTAWWLEQIGREWVNIPFPREDGCFEHLAVMEDGWKIDLAFCPMSRLHNFIENGLHPVYERGYQVILDKDGLTGQLPPPAYAHPPFPQPTNEAFQQTVKTFWYEVYRSAKYIKRGDIWSAKLRLRFVQDSLLQMIEWVMHVRHGWEYDTWHNGRNIHQWADEDIQDVLPELFAGYSSDENQASLQACGMLFSEIASEVADELGFEYPLELERNISMYVLQLFMAD